MADYRQQPLFCIIIGPYSTAYFFNTNDFFSCVMFLKVESSYVACKSFYRMILSHSKQIWHLYLDNKDLLKSIRKNPLSYDFALFTHIWLPQENYMANQVHFFRDSAKHMRQGVQKICDIIFPYYGR